MQKDLTISVIVPWYKDKGGKGMNVRTLICLLYVAGKFFAGVLVEIICRITEGLVDEEQWGFRFTQEEEMENVCRL